MKDAAPSRAPGILLFSELYPPAIGGSAVLFREVYSRLGDIPVSVLADEGKFGPLDVTDGSVRLIRQPVRPSGPGLMRPASLASHLGNVRRLRRVSAGERRVIHCARCLPEGLAAWLNRRLGGAPYICWAHGEDLASARLSRELTWLTKQIFRGAAAAMVNSRNTARELLTFGMRGDRMHVAYPGVDASRFRPDVDGSAVRARLASPGELVLLSVGRLQRRKGQDLAIRALPLLSDSLRVRYVIVGEGAERPRLEALTRELGVADRVLFAGAVDDADLPGLYAACDVFLLPNRVDDDGDFEGFGIVFSEAAATGRPSIGGRSGGVPEAVLDGETGLLVSGTDPGELADAIRRLAASPELRERLGSAGRARVCRELTWEQAAKCVASVHADVARREWG